MTDHFTSASKMASAPRIDPDKLLELCRKRHSDAGVTLSWPMMLQIIDQLRAASPFIVAPAITPEMVEAAEDAYMPFGDMRAALETALSVAPVPNNEAIAAAEALEEAADETVPAMHKMAHWLRARAKTYRRQADHLVEVGK